MKLNDYGTAWVVDEVFFNLLDIGTSNSLVLDNEFLKEIKNDECG